MVWVDEVVADEVGLSVDGMGINMGIQRPGAVSAIPEAVE